MPTHDKVLRAIRKAAAAKHLTHTRVRLPELRPPYWTVIRRFNEHHSEVVFKGPRHEAELRAAEMIDFGLDVQLKEVKP